MGPGQLPRTPEAGEGPVAGLEHRPVPGSRFTPHRQEKSEAGLGVGDRATLAAGSLSQTEPSGRAMAACVRFVLASNFKASDRWVLVTPSGLMSLLHFQKTNPQCLTEDLESCVFASQRLALENTVPRDLSTIK
jgi:hypothetical protein